MLSKTIFITFFTLLVTTALTFSQDKCTSEIDVYGRTQTITANLLNYLSDPGKIKEVTDYYGEQTQIANAYIKEGKYQEACDTYQEVIDKYDMKTIEEQYYEKHPEKRAEHQEAHEKSKNPDTASSSNAETAVSATDTAGKASGDSATE